MSITRKLKTTLSHSPLSELLNFLYTYACYRYIFHFARTGRAELFQRRQTAIILSYARQHSRYFGGLLKPWNRITAANAIEVLHSLPVLDKAIIRREGKRIFSDETDPEKSPRISTGGSSGSPLYFPMLHSPLKFEAVHQYYLRRRMGWRFDRPMAAIGGFPPSDEGLRQHRYYSDTRANFPYGKYVFSCFHINDETVNYYIEALNRIRPAILVSYPSALAELAASAMRRGLRLTFPLTAVYVTSENFTDRDYHTIRQFLSCPIWEQYGQTEAGIFAWRQEHETCLTVSPLYGYTEVLDEETLRPVKVGEKGEIFVTGFHNRGLPFIRYATGDYAVYQGRREDGAILISRLQGRTGDYLIGADGQKVFVAGLNHYRAFDRMASWQMEQSEKGKVIMRIIKDTGFSESDEAELRREFASKKLTIIFEYPAEIAKSKRGKRIFVIQHLK